MTAGGPAYPGAPGFPPGGQGFAPGQAGPGGFPPQKRGIDPDSIPSPVVVMAADQERFQQQVYQTSSRSNPPLTSTHCLIVDDGNCSPKVVRSTLYNIPSTDELSSAAKVPICLVIQPLANPGTDDNKIPVIDHGPSGPVRCRRCKAYICVGAVFVDGGRRFHCIFCQCVNEVPETYFCHLDHTGRRRDIEQRPELTCGSVDYVATPQYSSREVHIPSILFAIDVSYAAVQSGALVSAVHAIRASVDALPRRADGQGPKIGIITFDKVVHFYNLSESLTQPQMMVMSDVEDPFIPMQSGLFVDPVASKDIIESLLTIIPTMFANNKVTEPAFGSAVQCAFLALKLTGGRAIVFQTGLPSVAPGKLKKREDSSLLGTPKEKTLFVPQDDYYSKIAKSCTENGVCFDLFLFPNGYMDIATIGVLASTTGGAIYRYPFFKTGTDTAKVATDVRKILKNMRGGEGMLRVRCSTGLRAVDYYGAMLVNNTSDVELAGLDTDKSVVVRIKHDDKLNPSSDAHFQVALLYTTVLGERRIRVHTLSLRCTDQVAEIFRGADMDALANSICKLAIKDTLSVNLQEIRDKIQNQCVGILAAYRKSCANSNTGTGQLILPECLKLLPVYSGSMIKSILFRTGGDINIDERVYYFKHLEHLNTKNVLSFFYPRLFAIHDVLDDETGVPPVMRVSYDRLKENGAYLLEDGFNMFIWIGRQCSGEWILKVLGAPHYQAIDPSMSRLPTLSNGLSARVRGIIDLINAERDQDFKFTIIKQKEGNEPLFMRYLVEDKLHDTQSYVDYLCVVHREIQLALT